MTPREKWVKFLAGEDTGPMVCPLCDKWGAGDIAYEWKGEEPAPFKPSDNKEAFCGQIMMAETFGWDPLFYARINFEPRDKSLLPKEETFVKNGNTHTISTIKTPFGLLERVDEHGTITQRCIKDYLEDESDYEKMIWYTRKIMDFDRESALDEGRKLRRVAGDRGMIGTWVSPSAALTDVQSLFYHLADFPDAFGRLRAVKRELLQSTLDVYREAGFDFLFYCVPGTESISPGFYNEWMEDEVRETIKWWKSQCGFTLWHSCGHVRAFLELGSYNKAAPEIFETLSEPPVGNVASLSLARRQLDPQIVTKGNIPLDILLNGAPGDVRAEVRRVKRETAGYRHIIGLSDNILNGTPSENLKAFVDEGYNGR